jgi:hypothetical protein
MLLASLVIPDQQLKSGFANIKLGASQSEVVDILGAPHAIVQCGVQCGRFGGRPPPACVKEFSYLSIIIFVDVWIVSFDASERVVRKLSYRSP